MVFKEQYNKEYGSKVLMHCEICYGGLPTRPHEVSCTDDKTTPQIVEVISEHCQIL
jgi:hypothetical protein